MNAARATFGGGCFWCLEALFQTVPGVRQVVSGYAGGREPNPMYERVCSGKSGHAEVIDVLYEPETVTFRGLVDLFWLAHDPTTLNRQGADVGPQYRSIAFYRNEEELAEIKASKALAQKRYSAPIMTEILPLDTFYPAEDRHQSFSFQNPGHPYCMAVIRPKLAKFAAAREDRLA